MKHILWLALLLPSIAFPGPFTKAFCDANPSDGICVGFNLDRAEVDANEAAIADHEVRIVTLEDAPEPPVEPFVARLGAADSVGTVFNSFIQASGPEDVKTDFTIFVRQPDGTFATVGIEASKGGHWGTGNLRYSGSGCTGTAYYIAAWSFSSLGGDEGSIVISAQVGFDGIPYAFSIGPLFSATVASKSVPGHPITAPVCSDFSPFVQTGLRFAIPVQGLPAVVMPPSVAAIQLST